MFPKLVSLTVFLVRLLFPWLAGLWRAVSCFPLSHLGTLSHLHYLSLLAHLKYLLGTFVFTIIIISKGTQWNNQRTNLHIYRYYEIFWFGILIWNICYWIRKKIDFYLRHFGIISLFNFALKSCNISRLFLPPISCEVSSTWEGKKYLV